MVENKLSLLSEILRSCKTDAIHISGIENIRYLTGFTGSNADLIVWDGGGVFCTDSRYMEQAADEVSGVEIREYKRKIKDLAGIIKGCRFKKVGIEDSLLTYNTYLELEKELKGVRLVPVGNKVSILRGKKSVEEIRTIRKAIDIATDAYERLLPMVKQGVREEDLAIELEYLMRKGGAEAASFDIIVASGKRSALPHGKAGKKVVKKGEPVVIDFGSRYKGYHSDETATLFIGSASKRLRDAYQIVLEAHDRAIDAVRPGVRLSDVDKAARDWIENAGFGRNFGHGTGHGVGLEVHEWPTVSAHSDAVAEAGVVFTIEPGVYIPGLGGVRIEDMVLVTDRGCKVLTRIPKELTII